MIKEIIHDTISEKSEIEKQRKGYCNMKIYEKIFARLEELHMSQTELSRRTGIATSTISDWRKKQINPQADKLVSICKALDMTLVELLSDEENAEQTAKGVCDGVYDALTDFTENAEQFDDITIVAIKNSKNRD